jgi:Immunoglobulin I-set domain
VFCRVEISEELEISVMVAESTIDDTGEYAVRLYNEFGEVTSTTKVVVLFEAPSFISPPADCPVVVGGHGAFEASFRGVPAPRVTWLVSNVEVVETDRYHLRQETYQSHLSIDSVTISDAEMTYTCRVSNAAGETTSAARFVLIGMNETGSLHFP